MAVLGEDQGGSGLRAEAGDDLFQVRLVLLGSIWCCFVFSRAQIVQATVR